MSESDVNKPDPETEFLKRLSEQPDDEPPSGVPFLDELSRDAEQESEACVVAQVVEPSTPLVTIDASGADGVDGADGRGYGAGSALRASAGNDGQDAGPAGPGEQGGEIELTLRSAEAGFVVLEGRGTRADGQTIPIQKKIAIGDQGHIQLVADGGRGGDGGSGGDGQDGGRGRDGDDATRFFSGGNGGPGGDGGDGGNGTSGGDGGSGVRITVVVSSEDTHLLMLVQHSVQPGGGGAPGRNGSGGAGGRGGSGGSSYSWTTSESESYHVGGERKTRSVTRHHRKSGGFSGSSGSSGRSGTAVLHPGQDGAPGSFRMLVEQNGQLAQYDRLYDLELLDYDLNLRDRSAEPSSQIAIRQLTLKNTGGMPTPGHQPVIICLPASRWVEPAEPALRLPRSLESGESYTFHEETLTARIADVAQVPVGEPLRESDVVAPRARQAGANRTYLRFAKPKRFPIAFPADIKTVHSLVSLIPGQAALLRITITNNSQHDLGRDSSGRRSLGVRIALLNQQQADDLMLLDLQGEHLDWQKGWRQEIGLLRSGESTAVQAIVGVLPGASSYARADLATVLALGDSDPSDSPRDRHQRNSRLRVAQPYRFDAEAEILLVANHGTTSDERNAWEQIAARLGKRINTWDVSWEDEFSLSERRRGGQSLLRDFHGGTIVLSNSAFQTVLGLRHGIQYVSQVDLIRALESHGIRLLVLNEPDRDVSVLVRDGLVPIDVEAEHRFFSTKDFLSKIERSPAYARSAFLGSSAEPDDKTVRPDPLEQTSAIKVYGVFSPRAKRLRRQAVRLQRKLENSRPGQRFVISYQLPAVTTEKPSAAEERRRSAGWFFTHVHQGTLTVRLTVGDTHPNVIVLPASADEIRDPRFVNSPKTMSGLMQALHYREKVHLLDDQLRRLVGGKNMNASTVGDTQTMADAVADAILVDLVAEQATICRTGWTSLSFRKALGDSLKQLRFLAEHPFPRLDSGTQGPATRVAARLVAAIELLARKQRCWYEHSLFPWSLWRRGSVLRGQSLKLAATLRKNFFGDADRQGTDAAVRDSYRDTLGRLKQRKQRRRLNTKAAVRDLFLSTLTDRGIRTDVQEPLPRILDHDAWLALHRAEQQRESDRVELQQERKKRRSELLVADDGQPSPTQPTETQDAVKSFVAACANRNRADESPGS
jgi:hypothetical protein